MAIIVNLDVMMAKRKMTLSQLSEKVDITLANLSILKNNKAKAVRFSTLEAICKALDCQPGDIYKNLIKSCLFFIAELAASWNNCFTCGSCAWFAYSVILQCVVS